MLDVLLVQPGTEEDVQPDVEQNALDGKPG